MSDEDQSDDDFSKQEFEAELALVQEMQQEEVEGAESVGDHVNNKVGLLARLAEFKQDDLPWIERLDYTTGALDVDAHDDLKREAEFYEQSLRGVHTAILQLDQARIPYVRPGDYFAEMIKPDSQMRKIKDSLLKEKLKMQTVQNRIKNKDSRKYAKQVHAQRQEEKNKEKKETMSDFKKSKSANIHNELKIERSVHGTINDALKTHANKSQSKKRKNADIKYGFGGKKKHIKGNDSQSAGEMRGFSAARNKKKAGLADRKPPRKKAGGKTNRPGKARRDAAR